jgi:hypothetical protein
MADVPSPSTNPYAPPAAAAPDGPEATEIRKRLLSKEAWVRVLGLHILLTGVISFLFRKFGALSDLPFAVLAVSGLFGALQLLAGYSLAALWHRGRLFATIFVGLLTPFQVFFAAAAGMRYLEGWSLGDSGIVSALGQLALIVPAFVVLLTRDGRFILSAEYPPIVAATPSLHFWRTRTAVLGFLLILLVAGSTSLRFGSTKGALSGPVSLSEESSYPR